MCSFGANTGTSGHLRAGECPTVPRVLLSKVYWWGCPGGMPGGPGGTSFSRTKHDRGSLTGVTETGYMYFETGKFIRGLGVDSVIIMTGKTETNLRISQLDPQKIDPKYMYFHRLREILTKVEKISSSISVLI